MADLMTGLVPDPFLVNSVTKEALKIKLSLFEIYGIHLSLLYTDAVALLTLAVLSIERFIALVFPVVHAGGVRKRNEIILVVSVWLLAVLIVLPYLKIQFIRQLLIFSSVNIVFAVVSLIITTVTYKYKLRPAITNMRRINSKIFFRKNASVNVIEPNRHLRNKQKVTRTFILMLVVFLFTYLPAVITIMYMNFCGKECNCIAVHVMRDISTLFILSSSVVRPLNFILTLKHLRISVTRFFKKNNTVGMQ